MKKSEIIINPIEYFQTLCGLHDARIDSLRWNSKARNLIIEIEDLNVGFLDLPEYGGFLPAEISFINILSIDINIDIKGDDDTLNIYDLDIVEIELMYNVSMKCAPSGIIKLNCKEVHLASLSDKKGR